MMPPELCPNCGATVPRSASACPNCGADDETGWSEEARYATAADLGVPDEDFNYDEFARQEFGPPIARPAGLAWYWWLVGIGLLAIILLLWIL